MASEKSHAGLFSDNGGLGTAERDNNSRALGGFLEACFVERLVVAGGYDNVPPLGHSGVGSGERGSGRTLAGAEAKRKGDSRGMRSRSGSGLRRSRCAKGRGEFARRSGNWSADRFLGEEWCSRLAKCERHWSRQNTVQGLSRGRTGNPWPSSDGVSGLGNLWEASGVTQWGVSQNCTPREMPDLLIKPRNASAFHDARTSFTSFKRGNLSARVMYVVY